MSKAGIIGSNTGSTKIRGKPYNFLYAGYVLNGSLSGSSGYYWSSTAGGSNLAYNLDLSSSYVITSTNGRYYGVSVRCIAP